MTGTPVPSRDIERTKSIGSGPVVTYYLGPEELARYREMAVKPKRLGVRDRLAMQRRIGKSKKEEKQVTAQLHDGQRVANAAPSKVEFLRQIAAGKSIGKLEWEWNMKPGSLYYWVGKWNLKGIKPDQAKLLLDEMALDCQTAEKPVDTKTNTTEDRPLDIPDQYREIADELHKQKGAEIERLRKQVDEFSSGVLERDRTISELTQRMQDLREENEQLKAERDALLRTVEKAVDDRHDPVNHPAYYTAGRIECIDAIESATVGLTGGAAFCTGTAIEYLWHWSRKGGVEDLKRLAGTLTD